MRRGNREYKKDGHDTVAWSCSRTVVSDSGSARGRPATEHASRARLFAKSRGTPGQLLFPLCGNSPSATKRVRGDFQNRCKKENRRKLSEVCGDLVRPAEFESVTFGVGVQRSIQLSYGRVYAGIARTSILPRKARFVDNRLQHLFFFFVLAVLPTLH